MACHDLAVTDTPARWRLLRNGAHDGAENMAADEALLRLMDVRLRAGGEPVPILRLYAWRPAAVSAGRHQDLAEACCLPACHAEGVDVVARPTGGRAVLHDEEVTFAVIAPARGRFGGAGVVEASRTISLALVRGLRRLGVDATAARGTTLAAGRARREACFAATARAEVVARGRKLCGSAQFRGRDAVLQHGSLPIVLDADRHGRLLGADPEVLSRKAVGLAECLDVAPRREDVETALALGFAEELGADLQPDELDVEEAEAASVAVERLRANPAAWRPAPREALAGASTRTVGGHSGDAAGSVPS
jgi:lipoate-protein ligase A